MSLSMLQQYSSSDDEEPPLKRLPAPNLPALSLPISITRTPITDPEKHQNRKRSFPHEAGNWATYVAIEFLSDEGLNNYCEILQSKLSSVPLHFIDHFHISLTKVFVLRHHWIVDFVANLKDHMHNVNNFSLTVQGLSIYVNDDKSRTFVALNVKAGNDNLNSIVDILDKYLEEYSLPKFYKDRSFHMSILWGLGDLREDIKKMLKSISTEIHQMVFTLKVTNCFCKTGNKLFSIPFCS